MGLEFGDYLNRDLAGAVGVLSGGAVYGVGEFVRHQDKAYCEDVRAQWHAQLRDTNSLGARTSLQVASRLVIQNRSCFRPVDVAEAQTFLDELKSQPKG
jgi:hypothetical protein